MNQVKYILTKIITLMGDEQEDTLLPKPLKTRKKHVFED
jgi:hypothetical protein